MAAPIRHIALFGPRNCGKTVYLGALYGTSTNGGQQAAEYHVASHDDASDPTHIYLARTYRHLAAGSWPPGTAFDELKHMSLTFTTGGVAYKIILPDVGGELTQRAEDAAERDLSTRELKEKILREYQDYHGFLVFAPAGAASSVNDVEYKWEVDALVQALKERTRDGGLISRPVAVLLSKCDLLGPDGDHEVDAAAYFRETYPALSAGLTATCKNLRVFPISATGQLVDGKPPIPLTSYNLGAPVAWLLRTSDEVLIERLEANLDSWTDVLFRRARSRPGRPRHFTLSLAAIDQFLEDVPHGPFAERAQLHRRTLLRRRRARRAKIGVSLACATLAVVAFAGAVRDRATYAQFRALMVAGSSSATPDEVLHRVNGVLDDRSRFMGRFVGWWRELELERDKYYRSYEDTTYNEIEKINSSTETAAASQVVNLAERFESRFPTSSHLPDVSARRSSAQAVLDSAEDRRAYGGVESSYARFKDDRKNVELAKSLLEKCSNYLESYKGGLHTAEVQKIKVDVEVTRIEHQQNFDLAQLEVELAKAAENALKCHELCSAFLSKSPNHPEATRVKSRRDEYLRKADDQAWESVLANAARYPNLYESQISSCQGYTVNALFNAHREDAKNFRETALRGLDRSTYEEIRDRAKNSSEPEVLDAVQKLCRAYLDNRALSHKAMADEVKAWLKWFDSWVQGRDFYVEVESVRVNRNSQWNYSFYWPTVWAELHVNGSSDRSGKKYIDLGRDERGLPNSRLGPFHWKWNDPDVVALLHYDGANPPSFGTDFRGDSFLVRHLNGRMDFDGGKISLWLICPDVIPPLLSPYKE